VRNADVGPSGPTSAACDYAPAMRTPIAAGLLGALVLSVGGGGSLAATAPTGLAFTRGDGALLVRHLGRTTRVAAHAVTFSWSPDGRRLAYVAPAGEIFAVDADGTHRGRLTRTKAIEDAVDWSPGGRQLVVERGFRLFLIGADGRHERPLTAGTKPAWSPKRGKIAFVREQGGSEGLYEIDSTGRGLRLLASAEAIESQPSWSPDGSRMAFVATALGLTDVYVVDVQTKQVLRLTQDAVVESSPVWSRDGGSILYLGDHAAGGPLWSIPASGGVATPLGGPPAATSFRLRPPVSRELPPDFDQRPPSDLAIQPSGGRYLLGFTSASDNIGPGPLSIVASRPSTAVPTMRAAQRVRIAGGGARTYPGIGNLRFVIAFPHMHWHLLDFQRYELRRASDHALIVRDRKSGFCLADHWGHIQGPVPGKPRAPVFTSNCAQHEPRALAVSEGTSVGYTDRYPAFFHGQNLDITHVRPGVYVLVHRTNPKLVVREERYENNAASVLIRLFRPGGVPAVRVLRICPASEWCGR
jgi:lysyl oxidase/WD40 repeat protein